MGCHCIDLEYCDIEWFALEMNRNHSVVFEIASKYHILEMVTHSSVLAWRIPGTAEPGGLLSMELHRVGHD